METAARKHRCDARWMLSLLTLLALHCCRKGAVAQLMPDETSMMFLFESTTLQEPLPATTGPSMAVSPTSSLRPSSSFEARPSSAVAATQTQPSSSEAPSSTVPEPSSSSLQGSGQITPSVVIITIVPSLSSLSVISSQLLPRTSLSVMLLQSTQRPTLTSSTDSSLAAASSTSSLRIQASAVELSSSLALLQSTALSSSGDIIVTSVGSPPLSSSSGIVVGSPSQVSTSTQLPTPITAVTSGIGAEESSALSLAPTSPVPVPTSPVPEPTSLVPEPTSPVPEPTSLVPEPTSPVPEPITSTEAQTEPTSSLVQPSTMLTTVVAEVLSSSSSRERILTTSARGVLPSNSISDTTPTSTPGEILPSSSSSTVLPVAGSSESTVGQTESAAVPPSSRVEEASTVLPVPSTRTQPTVAAMTSPPPGTDSPLPSVMPSPSGGGIGTTEPPTTSLTEPPTTSSTEPPTTSLTEPPTTSSAETTGTPTTSSTETTAPPPPTTEDPTSTPSFFTLPVLIGISVGGAVIAILLLVIFILCCCCCVCNHASKSRRYSMDPEDSAENPVSIFANGRYPQKSRESNESVQAYELNYIQMQNPTYEDSEDHLHEPISQLSGDIFREASLPGLSPLSYNPQLDALYQISVDHPDEESLSAANTRSSLLGKFPHSSPSLAVPTRMGLSLEKEETKSSHGSKTSIPGSSKPSSYQGSRVSVLGSKHSIQSSRSSFLNSSHSRDDMKPLFMERCNSSSPEDDFLGIQLSGRTGSPFLNGDTMESPTDDSLVPTRDSPLGAPLATSHALKHGKKDFASLTCIPNHQAIADEFGYDFPLSESTPKVAESHVAESILLTPRKKSSSKINLGALTTLEQESKSEAAEKPIDVTDSERPRTVSEPPPKTSGDSKAKALSTVKDSPKSNPAAKKPKSRAMSRLEKLTSLDHIRASLRLKKKKVSFQKTPKIKPPTPKSKKKKPVAEPEPVMFANKTAAADPSGENGLESPIDQPPAQYQEPKRPPDNIPDAQHSKEEVVFSPDIYPEDFAGGFHRHYAGRPRVYSDMHGMSYPQLSQPTYFPGHMGGGQYQSAYPQLSQPYYQLSQGAYYPPHLPYPHTRAPLPLPSHSLPPLPSHMQQSSEGSGREPYGQRYADAAIPGAGRYPDVVTPDAYLPPNHDRFRDISSPDQFTDSSSFMDRYHNGARSPDTFTETSNTSERYQATSPDGYMDPSNRYRDVRSPDRWTDSSYPNYDEPVSPTRLGYAAPERFLDDRHRGNKIPEHFHEMGSRSQRRNSGDRLLENFNSSRRHSLEMHSRYPDGMDSGRRNGLQKGRPDSGTRHGADHRRQHSSDSMDREGRRPLDGYSDSFSEQKIRSPERFSTYSDTSASDKFTDASITKSHVSWSTEVIEYPRTPSPDMEYGSDFDAL